MVKLLIIADDFTGALDTGVQFAKRGICTQVFTYQKLEDGDIKPDTEVLVVDAESRPMPMEAAYRAVHDIARWAHEKGIEIIFKKTDSALRGNIGMELQAVADIETGTPLFFIPGHPDIQRVTKEGIHYISGELVADSVFGKDPFEPVTRSYIPDIIKEQSELSVTCIRADEPITCQMVDMSGIVVCDTEKVEDIDRRLDELVQMDRLRLIAGCAALGERLAEKIPFHYVKKKSFRQTDCLYVACGSLNTITCKQVRYAEQNCGFIRRNLTMEQKLKPRYYTTQSGKKFLEEMVMLCKDNKRIIVDSFDMGEHKDDFLEVNKISPDEVRTLIPEAHGHIVKEIIEQKLDVTALMTGGDTLMGYMKLIGCTQIEPVCEIEQGVVVSLLKWNGYDQQVISKSGGFGTEDILCRIAQKIIR